MSSFELTVVDWESSSEGASDETPEHDSTDEEECQFSSSKPKLQFRKHTSSARWNDQMGMAEVLENKGKLWTTTGIVRHGKIYCSIEETLFLTEMGALLLYDDNGRNISLEDVYRKVAGGKFNCFWEQFEVFRHMKSLGYIVRRHGVPWSMKRVKNNVESVCSQSSQNKNVLSDIESKDGVLSIIESFNEMKINEAKPVFDIFLPNSKFRKSCPGEPIFLLCLAREYPPPKAEIQELEKHSGGIPLKFCHVEHGRVGFFSFDTVKLPILP